MAPDLLITTLIDRQPGTGMRLGDWTFTLLSDGRFRLDGGASFGIVPKPLWEKQIAADGRNRVPVALRCLLASGHGRRVLIDTGIGDRWDAKQRDIYGMERRAGQLLVELESAGIDRRSITDVVLTHLHFDHAGGACLDLADGMAPAFTEARWWVQRQNWDWAHGPSERDQASYRAEDFEALADTGRLELLDGPQEVLPGLWLQPVHGHTPGMQIPEFRTSAGTLVFLADLIPTTAHLHLPWIAGYDLNPLLTLSEKRHLLTRALEDDFLLVLQHDPRYETCRVAFRDGRFQARETGSLNGDRTAPEADPAAGGTAAGGQDTPGVAGA
ncbi:MAG: MBL fold metallo-hydrolase [Candidatus Krumholzibacteria bacterium]|nr:MBL fold metallo-hydrolase [Candidatus Krumholzibacteria bacterium]